MRRGDGPGDQGGVGGAGVAVDEGLDGRDQPADLGEGGRGVGGRRQSARHVQIAAEQGRGEGLFAHAGLFGRQGRGLGQPIGALGPLARHQGQFAGQVQAIGAAALGVQRDRRPDLGNGGLGRVVGDDDMGRDIALGRLGRAVFRFVLERRGLLNLVRFKYDGGRMGVGRIGGRRSGAHVLRRRPLGQGQGEDGQGGGEQARTGGDHAATLHGFPCPRKRTDG